MLSRIPHYSLQKIIVSIPSLSARGDEPPTKFSFQKEELDWT